MAVSIITNAQIKLLHSAINDFLDAENNIRKFHILLACIFKFKTNQFIHLIKTFRILQLRTNIIKWWNLNHDLDDKQSEQMKSLLPSAYNILDKSNYLYYFLKH